MRFVVELEASGKTLEGLEEKYDDLEEKLKGFDGINGRKNMGVGGKKKNSQGKILEGLEEKPGE